MVSGITLGYLCLNNKGQISLQHEEADSYPAMSGLSIEIRSVCFLHSLPTGSFSVEEKAG